MKAVEIKYKLEHVFDERQSEVLSELIYESSFIKESDFNELKSIVKDMTVSQALYQQQSDERFARIEKSLQELNESHKELAHEVKELAQEVKELAEEMRMGFKILRDQISALGSRWGIMNEATFRATIKGILSRQKGIEVRKGFYGAREVDVVISNGEHILLEITSQVKSSDLDKIVLSGEDYKNQHQVEPTLMIASTYMSPKVMKKLLALPQKIELFSYDSDEE